MTKKKEEEKKAPKTPYDMVVGGVMNQITQLQNAEQIHFPADYSPQNALQSAWLTLQETKDKDKKPVLDVCTKSSVTYSLLDMLISGLSPAKDQGYFIAYGNKLTWVQSYFGAMTIAKRVDPRIADDGIIAEIKYEDDELEYDIVKGRRVITAHRQKLENMGNDKIEVAYCLVIDKNGEIIKTEIMTFEEIKESWRRSPTKPIDDKGDLKPGSNHAQHPVEFCKRTVIKRACKPIINSSSDKVLLESVNRAEFIEAQESSALLIEENANKETIDVTPESEDWAEKDDSNLNGKPSDEELAEIEKQEADEMPDGSGPGF